MRRNRNGLQRLFCAGALYVSLDLCLLVINFRIIPCFHNCIKQFKLVQLENPKCKMYMQRNRNGLRRWRLFCAGAPNVSLYLLLCLWVISLKSFIVWETIKNGSNGKSNVYKMCMQLTRTVASVLHRCSIRLFRSIIVSLGDYFKIIHSLGNYIKRFKWKIQRV